MKGLQAQIGSIGEMDELVSFYSVTRTMDLGGGTKESLVLVSENVRAKVTFASTDETAATIKQEKFRTEILLQCRYSSTLDNPELRILWRSKYYDIFGTEATARKRFLIIKGRNFTT